MATPKRTTIANAIVSRLLTNGVGEVYAVEKVVRTPVFYGGLLLAGYDTFYTLSAFGRTAKEQSSFTVAERRQRYAVALCRRFGAATEDPFVTTEAKREEVQEQLLADFELKLLGPQNATGGYQPHQLGGLCVDLAIDDEDVSVENTRFQGWAAAFVAITAHYTYTEAAP